MSCVSNSCFKIAEKEEIKYQICIVSHLGFKPSFTCIIVNSALYYEIAIIVFCFLFWSQNYILSFRYLVYYFNYLKDSLLLPKAYQFYNHSVTYDKEHANDYGGLSVRFGICLEYLSASLFIQQFNFYHFLIPFVCFWLLISFNQYGFFELSITTSFVLLFSFIHIFLYYINMTYFINCPLMSAIIIPIILLFSYKIPPKVTHHTFSDAILIISYWSGSVIGWIYDGNPVNPRFIVGNKKQMIALLIIGLMFYQFIYKILAFIEYIIRFPGLSMFAPTKSLHISILSLLHKESLLLEPDSPLRKEYEIEKNDKNIDHNPVLLRTKIKYLKGLHQIPTFEERIPAIIIVYWILGFITTGFLNRFLQQIVDKKLLKRYL